MGQGQTETQGGPAVVVALAAVRRAPVPPLAPTFVAERDVCVDAVQRERERLLARGRPAPSLEAALVKACALALRDHPRVNASWHDGAVVEHEPIHVGVAVVAPEALPVPVLRDADRLSLTAISWAADELARQARAGRLCAAATGGCTFTVAGAGSSAEDAFATALDPQPAAVLAVRSPLGAPDVLRLRLTCDARVLGPSEADAFLAAVAGALEVPLALAS